MSDDVPQQALQMFSTVRTDNRLELGLREVPVPAPKDDEVLIRVDAAPINPSDLAVMLSFADSEAFESDSELAASGPIPEAYQRYMAGRADIPVPVGNEGAGLVVRAGSSPEAAALVGKTVALAGGGFYAQYRAVKARDCMVVPEGTSAEEGASSFVNPLTALGMIGTMRLDRFEGLVHTAAASNLGQMLVKLCKAEGVGLVNIVRSDEQAALLKSLGAQYIVNSTSDSFVADLIEAISATKAFLAFDATGGGKLATQILTAMEQAAVKVSPSFGPYGSTQMKQVYIYGGLQMGPTELTRGYGMKWGVGGWLLNYFLDRVGPDESALLRDKVAAELKTTFASHYTKRITLAEAIQPANIAAYNRKSTGEKYLVTPQA